MNAPDVPCLIVARQQLVVLWVNECGAGAEIRMSLSGGYSEARIPDKWQLTVDLGRRFRVMRFFVASTSTVGMVRQLFAPMVLRAPV